MADIKLLKTRSLDNAIREFSMLYKYGKRTRDFLRRFFYSSLVFYILEALLIKQLFHSCLLDMRWL